MYSFVSCLIFLSTNVCLYVQGGSKSHQLTSLGQPQRNEVFFPSKAPWHREQQPAVLAGRKASSSHRNGLHAGEQNLPTPVKDTDQSSRCKTCS